MKRIKIGRRRKRRPRRGAIAMKLVRELPNLFKLVFRLLRDPRVPRLDKVLFGAVAVYMLTPIDFIPDFLGAFGWVDDIYLAGLALGRLLGSAGPDLLLRHWDGDPRALGYIIEGVDEIGGGLPRHVRAGLDSIAANPRQMPRRRGVRRIRVDDEARVHIEE
ncbi:MAG TPA: DUF1232 domain-containing protein [Longimicrobiales bacterium]|nr:DUF1232 domain-containing protein [Longimicrobiales bacterium]